MDPILARKTWRTLEPVHALVYFVPEATARYRALGLEGPQGYFAGRAAPMGPVPAEVVVASFFNFEPGFVHRSLGDAWAKADPATVVAARRDAADAALRRALDADVLASAELAEAAELARRAAEVACERPQGRPLFAAYAGLDWPDAPHLVLHHAQTLLREYRGDGHVAALLLAGIGPVEALVLHAATGEAMPAPVLQLTRAWSDEDWAGAEATLRERGLLVPPDPDGGEVTLSDSGSLLREGIEELTDRTSAAPYAALGEDGCARLRDLVRPISRRVVAGGLLQPDPDAWSGLS